MFCVHSSPQRLISYKDSVLTAVQKSLFRAGTSVCFYLFFLYIYCSFLPVCVPQNVERTWPVFLLCGCGWENTYGFANVAIGLIFSIRPHSHDRMAFSVFCGPYFADQWFPFFLPLCFRFGSVFPFRFSVWHIQYTVIT